MTNEFVRDVGNIGLTLDVCESVRVFEARQCQSEFAPARVADHSSGEAAVFVEDVVADFDLVHVEGYFLIHLVPPTSATPIFLCEENVEFAIVRQQGGVDSRRVGWRRVLELERAAWRRASLVGTVSVADALAMRQLEPELSFIAVPNGTDHMPRVDRARERSEEPEVLFVGNFGWSPSRQGAERLLSEIWPRVVTRHPTARLRMVGAGINEPLRQLAAASTRVDLIGEVPSMHEEFARADVFVAPISSGSGVMVKMAEAIRSGSVIVTNQLSLRGYEAAVQECVSIAETDDHFARQIAQLLYDPARREHLSRLTLAAATTLTTWQDSAARMASAWSVAMKTGSRS
ncbi:MULTISPECIES: glycosyltransferase [unclassified Agromyces]|uniref:glycosyltransferase n=1 Tax=unclassified Agromyces TaxID=2639701 RepID=UPI0030154E51